ncbi:MAG: hypothetical protein AAFR81_15810 [Chloroflexota bacterium]
MLFIRYTYSETLQEFETAQLVAIDLETQALAHLFEFPRTGGEFGFTVYSFAISPTDESIAWVYAPNDPEDGAALYLTNTATFETTEQLATYTIRNTIPNGIEFSADGRYLLTLDDRVYDSDRDFEPENSAAQVINIDSGEQITISQDYMVDYAGWTPTGSGLVYRVFDFDLTEVTGIYITSAPNAEGRKLDVEGVEALGIEAWEIGAVIASYSYGEVYRSIDWSENNLSLFYHFAAEGVLVISYEE